MLDTSLLKDYYTSPPTAHTFFWRNKAFQDQASFLNNQVEQNGMHSIFQALGHVSHPHRPSGAAQAPCRQQGSASLPSRCRRSPAVPPAGPILPCPGAAGTDLRGFGGQHAKRGGFSPSSDTKPLTSSCPKWIRFCFVLSCPGTTTLRRVRERPWCLICSKAFYKISSLWSPFLSFLNNSCVKKNSWYYSILWWNKIIHFHKPDKIFTLSSYFWNQSTYSTQAH